MAGDTGNALFIQCDGSEGRLAECSLQPLGQNDVCQPLSLLCRQGDKENIIEADFRYLCSFTFLLNRNYRTDATCRYVCTASRIFSPIFSSQFLSIAVSFQQSVYIVEEGEREVRVCLVLLQGPELLSPINIALTTVQSTARSGTDFEPLSILVQLISVGEPACFSITIIGDNIVEEDEQFSVVIHSDNPNVEFQQISATIIIQDSRKC